MSERQSAEFDATEETVLRILAEHTIGAFNGSQVACSGCRTWMTTSEWRRHQATLIADALRTNPSVKTRADDA